MAYIGHFYLKIVHVIVSLARQRHQRPASARRQRPRELAPAGSRSPWLEEPGAGGEGPSRSTATGVSE